MSSLEYVSRQTTTQFAFSELFSVQSSAVHVANRFHRIKCNRELPCQNCIVRSIPSQCNYRGHGPVPARGFRSAHAEDMQERLNRLESLVTTLVSQDQVVGHANPNLEDGNGYSFEDNVSREPETASIAGLQQGVGVLKVDGDASVYRGSTHWRDVMKEVTLPTVFFSARNNSATDLEDP
jgi:hypothetical protein